MLLLNKAKHTIRQYLLIEKSDRLLVGVSGGPDSVALLYVLNHLKKEFGFTLHVAHLNHMLRGEESEKDRDFVLALSNKFGLPLSIGRAKISPGVPPGRSSEEALRKVRLDFLFSVANKIKAGKIALGHNRDDQAETVLMRIIRGSGLSGLAAILPKRRIGEHTVIRPLIGVFRRDIEKFLKARNVKPRRDSSNSDEAYFRNRIRRKLLPELQNYNPNIKEVLASLAESAGSDYDYIYRQSRKVFGSLVKCDRRGLKLSLDRLSKQHPAIQNMALRFAFEALKGDTRRLTYRHIKEIRDLIYSRPYGSVVDLPSNISAKSVKPD